MAWTQKKDEILATQLYQVAVRLVDLYDFAVYLDNLNDEDDPTNSADWQDRGGMTNTLKIDVYQALQAYRQFMDDGVTAPAARDRLQEMAAVIATEFTPPTQG